MSRNLFYCSELSRQAAEKSYGTASIGAVWLLIEYPQAWGPHALRDSALSRAVKGHLNRLLKTIPRSRLLFIKQEPGAKERLNFFVVRSRESDPFIVKFELDRHERLLEIDVASVAAGNLSAGGIIARDRSLFLVCTHGKRDKCCAKFGYAVYKAARDFVRDDDDTGADVWQSSHVGGDRFAANLICFPHGLFYAHVTKDGGHTIMDEYRRRRLVLSEYRGRACYSFPVQAAEFFVRRETGLLGLDELRYLDQERLGETLWRVRFMTSAGSFVHQAQVASTFSEFQTFITCQSTEAKSITQYQLEDYRML
jgi:hypothetical protein